MLNDWQESAKSWFNTKENSQTFTKNGEGTATGGILPAEEGRIPSWLWAAEQKRAGIGLELPCDTGTEESRANSFGS